MRRLWTTRATLAAVLMVGAAVTLAPGPAAANPRGAAAKKSSRHKASLVGATALRAKGTSRAKKSATATAKRGSSKGLQQGAFKLRDLDDPHGDLLDAKTRARLEAKSKRRMKTIGYIMELLERNPRHPRAAELYFRLAEHWYDEDRYRYLLARARWERAMRAQESMQRRRKRAP